MLVCNVRWLVKVAVLSRLLFLVLSTLLNVAFEDFDSSTRITPRITTNNSNQNNHEGAHLALHGNSMSSAILDGLNKWDSVYFNHISRHGYEYEQMLAFAPAFPFLVSFLSRLVNAAVGTNDQLLIIQIIGFLTNSICHVVAAFLLYKLTNKMISSSTQIGPVARDLFTSITTLAFIFNPANIFMMSSYSESAFVLIQFAICLALESGYFKLAAVAISVSPLIRSNGLLNVVFLIYFYTKERIFTANKLSDTYESIAVYLLNPTRIRLLIKSAFKELIVLSVLVVASLVPYVSFQYHVYKSFCTIERIASAENHWCNWTIPVSYGYIQSHYWNVGFLRYFKVSQIPNFLLAAPICIVLFLGVSQIVRSRSFPAVLSWLGFKEVKDRIQPSREDCSVILKPDRTFVYACHIAFLALFGIFNIHVQILTRMLCSSSPFVYWTVAELILNRQLGRSRVKRKLVYIISIYFILYNILGAFLHTNFYPWT